MVDGVKICLVHYIKNNVVVPCSAGRCPLGRWECMRAKSEWHQMRQTLQRNRHDAQTQRETPGSGPSSGKNTRAEITLSSKLRNFDFNFNMPYSNLQDISQKHMQLCVLTREASDLLADFFQKTGKHFHHLWIIHNNKYKQASC